MSKDVQVESTFSVRIKGIGTNASIDGNWPDPVPVMGISGEALQIKVEVTMAVLGTPEADVLLGSLRAFLVYPNHDVQQSNLVELINPIQNPYFPNLVFPSTDIWPLYTPAEPNFALLCVKLFNPSNVVIGIHGGVVLKRV